MNKNRIKYYTLLILKPINYYLKIQSKYIFMFMTKYEDLENRIILLEREINCKNLEKKVQVLEREVKHLKEALQFQLRKKK